MVAGDWVSWGSKTGLDSILKLERQLYFLKDWVVHIREREESRMTEFLLVSFNKSSISAYILANYAYCVLGFHFFC